MQSQTRSSAQLFIFQVALDLDKEIFGRIYQGFHNRKPYRSTFVEAKTLLYAV